MNGSQLISAAAQHMNIGTGNTWTNTNTGTVLPVSGTVNFSMMMPCSSGALVSSTGVISAPEIKYSQSPKLPALSFVSVDEHGALVTLTLVPDASISASDVMKIFMLLLAEDPAVFSTYAYIKLHNLERHFKFTSP